MKMGTTVSNLLGECGWCIDANLHPITAQFRKYLIILRKSFLNGKLLADTMSFVLKTNGNL